MTSMVVLRFLLLVCATSASFAQHVPPEAQCQPLSAPTMQRLAEYIQKRYKIADQNRLELNLDGYLESTCYRKIHFVGPDRAALSLYLSPDGRFLSSDLLDSTIDPEEERRRAEAQVRAYLAAKAYTAIGSERARVTITIFSDFQCPYCQQAASILSDVLSSEREDTRLVFRHLPLKQHAWARIAATAASCVALQGSSAFWDLHDFLFAHQSELDAGNISTQVAEHLRSLPHLDHRAYDDCVSDHKGEAVVDTDIALAGLSIQSTPTIFVNTLRISGAPTAEQLRTLIRETTRPEPK